MHTATQPRPGEPESMRLSILLISLVGGIAGAAVTVGLDNALQHVQAWRKERKAYRFGKQTGAGS